MEAITIPTDVPAEVHSRWIKDLLTQASKDKATDPIMAYWGCYVAAYALRDAPGRGKDGTKYLFKLLDVLEQMRTLLQDNPAMTDPAASVYLENHAQTVFVRVDTDERSGRCDRNIALRFRLAMHYIELFRKYEASITRNYEGVEKAAHQQLMSEMDQKYKYAAWKAAQISKALRNGVAHVPGPHETPEEVAANAAAKEAEAEAAKAAAAFPSPPAEPEASARSSSETVTAPTGAGSGSGSGAGSGPTSRPSSAEAKPATTLLTPAPKPPTISFTHDTSDSPVSRVRDSGEWSTAATPGIDGNGSSEAWPGTKTGSEGARPTHIDLPGDGKDSGSRSADADADADTTNTDKTVRFRGFDGAPLSPAETFASVDQYSEIGPPPPTEVGVTPAQARPKSSPHVPKPVIPAVAPAPTPTQPSVPPQFKAAPAPKPKPSAPPAPKPASAPKPAPVSRPTPPAARPPPAPVATPSPRTAAGTRLGRRETEACQKHARWAISALDYDDYATARKELLAALAMLPPE